MRAFRHAQLFEACRQHSFGSMCRGEPWQSANVVSHLCVHGPQTWALRVLFSVICPATSVQARHSKLSDLADIMTVPLACQQQSNAATHHAIPLQSCAKIVPIIKLNETTPGQAVPALQDLDVSDLQHFERRK